MSDAMSLRVDQMVTFLLAQAEDEMDRAVEEIERGQPVLARFTFEAAQVFVAAAAVIQATDTTKH